MQELTEWLGNIIRVCNTSVTIKIFKHEMEIIYTQHMFDEIEYLEQIVAGHRWERVIRPPMTEFVQTVDIRRESNVGTVIKKPNEIPISGDFDLQPFIVGAGAFIWTPHDTTSNVTHVKFMRPGASFRIFHRSLYYGRMTPPVETSPYLPPSNNFQDPFIRFFLVDPRYNGTSATDDGLYWTLKFNSSFPVPLFGSETQTIFDPEYSTSPIEKYDGTPPTNVKGTYIGAMRSNAGIMCVSAVSSGIGVANLTGSFSAGLVSDIRTIFQPSTYTAVADSNTLPLSGDFMSQVIANPKHCVNQTPLRDGGVVCILGPDVRSNLHEVDYAGDVSQGLFVEKFTSFGYAPYTQNLAALQLNYPPNDVATKTVAMPIDAKWITPYDCDLVQTSAIPTTTRLTAPLHKLVYRNGMHPKSRLNIRVNGIGMHRWDSPDQLRILSVSWMHCYVTFFNGKYAHSDLEPVKDTHAELLVECGSQVCNALRRADDGKGYCCGFDCVIPPAPLKRDSFYVGTYTQVEIMDSITMSTESPAYIALGLKFEYEVSASESVRTCAPVRVVQYDNVSVGTQLTCNTVEHFEAVLKDRPSTTNKLKYSYNETDRVNSWRFLYTLHDMFEYENCPLRYIWKVTDYLKFIRAIPQSIPSSWIPTVSLKKRKRRQFDTDDSSLLKNALPVAGSSKTENLGSYMGYLSATK